MRCVRAKNGRGGYAVLTGVLIVSAIMMVAALSSVRTSFMLLNERADSSGSRLVRVAFDECVNTLLVHALTDFYYTGGEDIMGIVGSTCSVEPFAWSGSEARVTLRVVSGEYATDRTVTLVRNAAGVAIRNREH